MRLPWPLRRSTTPPTGAGITFGAGAGGGAWRRLPPIEGVVDRPPLVAPPAPFKAQLAGAQRPPPVLQRLGHERSASAPAGLVAGLAKPAQVIRPAADMPLRRLAGRLREWFAGDSTPADEPSLTVSEPVAGVLPVAETAPVIDHAAASAVTQVTGALTGGPRRPAGSAIAGVVRPTVSRSVAAPPGNRYTRADATALPLAAGGSVASSAPAEPPPMPVPTSHLPSLERVVGPARRLRLGPPVERLADATPSERVADSATATSALSAASSLPGQAEPASANPPPPTSQTTGGSAAALASAGHSATPPFRLRRAPVGRDPANASPGRATTASDPVGAPAGPPPSSPARQPAGPARSVQRSAVAPLTGERALRPTVAGTARSLQRAAEGSTKATPRINRGGEVSQAARQLGARAFSLGSDVFIPAEAGQLDAGGGRALLAHELTHVRQQSAAGSGSVAAGSASGMEAEARQAEAWSLSTDLSLAPRRPTSQTDTAAPPAPSASSPQAMVTAQGEGDEQLVLEQAFPTASSAPAGGPPLQLAEEGSAPPPAGAGGDTAPALGERELQELLRQLYPRLRTHLAGELLVSRERAGLLTDI